MTSCNTIEYLQQIAKQGNEHAVRSFVEANPDYTNLSKWHHFMFMEDTKGKDLTTISKIIINAALVQAAYDGDENTVKTLIAAGVNLNFVGKYGDSAIAAADHEGRSCIVKLLRDGGCRIECE